MAQPQETAREAGDNNAALMTSAILKPRPRQGFGTRGRPFVVVTNYTELMPSVSPFNQKGSPLAQEIHCYDVRITGRGDRPIPSRKYNRRAFEELVKRGVFRGVPIAFDGRCNAYAARKLPDRGSWTIEIRLEEDALPEECKYTLQFVKTLTLGSIGGLLNNSHDFAELVDAYEVLAAYQVICRDDVSKHFPTDRRMFFPPTKAPLPISGGLELRKAFFMQLRAVGAFPRPDGTAAHPKLVLNIDTASGTFWQSPTWPGQRHGNMALMCHLILSGSTVSSALSQGALRPDVVARLSQLDPRDKKKLEIKLRRKRVRYNHGPNSPFIRKAFQSVGAVGADRHFFTLDGGQQTNVRDFFLSTYGYRLQFPSLPCLVFGKRAIPMELCDMLPDQLSRTKLHGNDVTEALRFLTSSPHARFEDIDKVVSNELQQAFRDLEAFGLKSTGKLLEVVARQLPAPTLAYLSDQGPRPVPKQPNDAGSWNLVDRNQPSVRFLQPGNLRAWAVLDLRRRDRRVEPVVTFMKDLADKLAKLGIAAPTTPPDVSSLQVGGSQADMEQAIYAELVNAGFQARKKYGYGPDVIIVITEDKSDNPLYRAIKCAGDTLAQRMCTTQCVISKNVVQRNDQYLSNLAIKLNVKLGGICHRVDTPLTKGVPTMVVGADVSHLGPSSMRKPSIAAVVASMDRHCTMYAATARAQPLQEPSEGSVQNARSQEPIVELKSMMLEMLKKWSEKFQAEGVPTQIIYYRDGVSEGEYANVLEVEFNAIKMAVAEAAKRLNRKPAKVTFIICTKGTHTRFRPVAQRDADRSGNVVRGTVVDRGLNHPRLFDWYLVSHGGLKGTSRPCRYICLTDDSSFDADQLQGFTDELANLFQRATRSISIASPARYAHLFADRAAKWCPVNVDSDGASTAAASGASQQTADDRARDLVEFQAAIGEKLGHVAKCEDRMWWL